LRAAALAAVAAVMAFAGWVLLAGDRPAALLDNLATVDVLAVAAFAAAIFALLAGATARASAARRRAEAAAEAAAQKAAEYAALVESAPDATIVAGFDGRIILANAQAEALFGYRREELIGERVEILLPERYREIHAGRRADYRDAPRVRPMAGAAYLTARKRNGDEIPVEVSLSPVDMGNGASKPCVAAAVRDASVRMRRERELADARAEAEAASEAKSDFLSQMSHELRTPLNAVIGFAQMLQLDRDETLTERQQEYARIIQSSGRNLLDLINDILDLSAIESGRLTLSLEAVDVGLLLRQAVDVMGPVAAAAGVTLETSSPEGLRPARADELRLRQILLNLISNAIKYNAAGGGVSVEAEALDGEQVRVVVRDTGHGIPKERRDELFTPFSRLGAEHRGIEGTGIGLALAKDLVEAMGGVIGFDCAVGEGSVFWIDLPAAAAADTKARLDVRPHVATRAAAGGYSLLYVEDNPSNLKLMEHLVSTLPDVVMLSAATPGLGLELARAHRPDVIVVDLHLPEMSGFELLERLKAAPETRTTPVIALTAAAMPRDVRRGLQAGFFRYMTKPLDAKAFLAAVDDALLSRGDGDGNGADRTCA